MAGIQRGTAARALARRLAVQALYRWQINPAPWQDLSTEFAADPDMARADREYFDSAVRYVCERREELDSRLAPLLDRAIMSVDPIEHAVLWIALFELLERGDIPFRVVIDQAVGIARRFGATDGHRFVHGVLDRAARECRPAEH